MCKVIDVDYYFTMLIESLNAVKMKLVSYADGNKDKYVNERAFAYELYRQCANRLYDDLGSEIKWKDNRPSIVINAELYKCVEDNNKEDNKGRKFPDIVIHGGQHNTHLQLIVCEIKLKASETEIEEDLKKLYDYMDSVKMYNHPYTLAIFINIGPRNTFETNLKSALRKIDKSKGCLVCISYDCGIVSIVN